MKRYNYHRGIDEYSSFSHRNSPEPPFPRYREALSAGFSPLAGMTERSRKSPKPKNSIHTHN